MVSASRQGLRGQEILLMGVKTERDCGSKEQRKARTRQGEVHGAPSSFPRRYKERGQPSGCLGWGVWGAWPGKAWGWHRS